MITSRIDGRKIYYRNDQWFFYDNDEPIAYYESFCIDCGIPYTEFGLDIIFPDWQWEAINPKKDGVLCAGCIVSRASNLIGAIRIKAEIVLHDGVITTNT